MRRVGAGEALNGGLGPDSAPYSAASRLVIVTEVTKKMKAEIDAPSRDGCYISGLSMQGARFDIASSTIEKSRPREMYCDMPISEGGA